MQNNNDASAYDVSPAAAGTVCLLVPGADPLVKVENVFRYNDGVPTWRIPAGESVAPATHLPAMQDTDTASALRHSRWDLSGHGALRLTADARIASLSFDDKDGTQCVYTDGHTVSVKELVVDGDRKTVGTYSAADLPGVVVGSGSIVVEGSHTVIILR